MNQHESILKMPGYRVYEYLLVISPHQVLQEKIGKIKREIHEKHKCSYLLNRKSDIRLARFFSWQMMEEKIIQHLKVSAMGTSAFKVNLKDYGSFPSHTFFINVESKIPLQMLMKEIKTAKRLMKSPEKEPFFNDEFYIPLAIKLTPAQYNNLWPEYEQRYFTGNFIADNMLLLKKQQGEKYFQIAARLEFMNLPVSTVQGQLFG
ncbi:MAG: 2'-5' RNA ligase family protein [Ginsengibacter sp.]